MQRTQRTTEGASTRRARSIVVMALATALTVVGSSAAVAATTAEAGWWTSAPVAAAPDAADDGLLVQGGSSADEPFAYAAVAYALAAGETPTSLTLTVAEGSASTPNASLALCPLTDSFSAEQGGSMADAPEFDCSTKATASPSDDGSSYAFSDLAGLARDGTLAVAMLPTAPTDRVVITHPGPDALQTTATAASTDGPQSSFESGNDVATFGTSALPAQSSFDVPAPPAPAVAAPDAAETAASGDRQSVAAPATFRAQPTGTSDDRSWVPAVLFVGLFLLAATLWLSLGRSHEEPITTT